MDKILDILLFKFIDDTAFKPIMSILILISVTYSINIDHKCMQLIGQYNDNLKSLISIQSQTTALESNDQYDVLSDALKTWKNLMVDYQSKMLEISAFDEITKAQLQTNLLRIDNVFTKHLENLKSSKTASQQRFYYLQQLCNDKLDLQPVSMNTDKLQY